MKNIFYGKLPLAIKLRAFECYVSSIFLYNSELWTLTEKSKSSINAFHRKLIRTACLNIRWPTIITNNDLYTTTKVKPWSEIIIKRQLSWFGHLVRLPDDTPAKRSLNYSLLPSKKPPGRQKTTWIEMMKTHFLKMGMTWNEAYETAKDRGKWRDITKRCALS